MNKAFLLGAGMVVLLAACTKQGQPSTIEGEWAITRVAPALPDRLPDTVGLKEAMALFILSAHGDSLLPSMITINSKDMVLKAISGESDPLAYTIVGSDERGFRLETAQGAATMQLGPQGEATLAFMGQTYQLQRAAQRE